MVYVCSANKAAISAQLPDHPHFLLLLQRALGSYLAGPNATLPSLVTDFPRTVDNKVHHVWKPGYQAANNMCTTAFHCC